MTLIGEPQMASGDHSVIINGQDYRLGALLHEGRSSRIYAASSADSGGSDFVIKYYVCRRDDEVWDVAMREIEAMQILEKGKHIVKLRGYSVRQRGDGTLKIFLLMNQLPCCTEIFGEGRADEKRVTELCRDIAEALDFMRRKGLVHGDVKPSNIYYRYAEGWQLGDFGSVMRRGERPRFVSEGYCSPAVLRGAKCDIRFDFYSLGITAYKLLSGGRLPFCDRPCEQMIDDEVYRAIERRMNGELIPPIDGVSTEMNDLVFGLLARSGGGK